MEFLSFWLLFLSQVVSVFILRKRCEFGWVDQVLQESTKLGTCDVNWPETSKSLCLVVAWGVPVK